jgi:D-glycero-alpha-D-manno-heptose-7-phosphate kinase
MRISYRKVELVRAVRDIEHNVFRECLTLCGFERDVELHNFADLPAFTGLGSSSAFTVSLLHALHTFRGEFLHPQELAYKAIHVERHILKDNVGCQDQVLAAFGGFNLVEFRTEKDIVVNRVPLSPVRLAEFEQHLFLVFTGITRKASEVVAHQLQRVDLNGAALRTMRGMVYEGYEILVNGRPLREFGELLHRAWEAKRTLDVGVSNCSARAAAGLCFSLRRPRRTQNWAKCLRVARFSTSNSTRRVRRLFFREPPTASAVPVSL